MKIEIGYDTADAITRESLKDSLLTCSNDIMRGVTDIIKEKDLKKFEFDDVIDSIINYAQLAGALRYYLIEDEWRAALRESMGYEK